MNRPPNISHPCPALLMIVVGLAIIMGCSSDNSLSGSLSEVYNLQFDSVRARLYRSRLPSSEYVYSELCIEYVSRATGAVPVRVSLRANEVEVKAAKTYKLHKKGDITGQLADGTEIPRFSTGKLTLDEYPKNPNSNKKVAGSFNARFPTGRDTLSLTGDFVAELEVFTTVR